MKKRRIEFDKIRRFETFLRNEEKSAATVEKYIRDITRFAEFAGADDITKQSIMDYKNMLSGSYAVSSANSMIAALNAFLRFCGWHDLCVKQFRMQRQAYCSEDKELTREEYIRLINTAKSRQNKRLDLIIQAICGTGIRVSELKYITVESVRMGEAVVSCKGNSRRIFIVPELKKKLLRYIKDQGIHSGSVFITRSGRPLCRSNIWREMKSLCKDAGVSPTKVFPHNLRHLFARTFYRLDKDIAKLADILGHASINTTRIYIVTTGAEHKRKMENMRLII